MRKCDIKNCTAGEPHSTVPARLMYTFFPVSFSSTYALRYLYPSLHIVLRSFGYFGLIFSYTIRDTVLFQYKLPNVLTICYFEVCNLRTIEFSKLPWRN